MCSDVIIYQCGPVQYASPTRGPRAETGQTARGLARSLPVGMGKKYVYVYVHSGTDVDRYYR